MNNKQFNEIYRDFESMSKSKTITEIAKWLDDHEEYELINRDEISITFKLKECVVCITKGLINSNVNLKKI